MDLAGNLDDIDLKIIKMLKKDSRMSFRKISSVCGVSETSIRRRVKKMLDGEYIKQFTIIINEDKVNLKE